MQSEVVKSFGCGSAFRLAATPDELSCCTSQEMKLRQMHVSINMPRVLTETKKKKEYMNISIHLSLRLSLSSLRLKVHDVQAQPVLLNLSLLKDKIRR